MMDTVSDTVIKILDDLQINEAEVLKDYRVGMESRHASLMGRREVFSGKAKFGIFGDGKEVAQLAMARAFRPGDFRSGYYRDQTFMMALGELDIAQYFAQLYAHPDVEAEPASAGRLMNGHFATRMLDDNGLFKSLTDQYNSTADISPTAGQMPRLLGLAWASKLFRDNPGLHHLEQFSIKGNEVAFGTIGNASTSEGMFFEAMNAAGVLQVPMLMSIWDDEYGISVSKEHHTTKGSISEALVGLQRTEDQAGFEIFVVKGWDYPALLSTYQKAAELCRTEHVPVLVHVVEMTQPQGHSTSGSHERYKSKERLAWEDEFDPMKKMAEWILEQGIATEDELKAIDEEAKKTARTLKGQAWKAFRDSVQADIDAALGLLQDAANQSKEHGAAIQVLHDKVKAEPTPMRRNLMAAIKKALRLLVHDHVPARAQMIAFTTDIKEKAHGMYSSHLYSESPEAAMKVPVVPPVYTDGSANLDGREILQACFDAALERDPKVVAFGEDVGKIGGVNQAFAGLQEKYGLLRVSDTSIREVTILGQGMGAAMRGLRPIAEIQYLDYLLYALVTMSDDLATLQYRTRGGQKAPVIIRTRGHRLEGVWHTGSPIGMILHSLRGIYVLTPRNMVQAAGMYNTMLQSDDTALLIECLNGYRLKERMPDNVGEFTVPLGQPEVIREGKDVTIVTYGSMCRIVMQAASELANMGIEAEVIDVQTLLPFDVDHTIAESLKKTNRVIFADEDVPGGGTAYMMQKVLEEQNGYHHLDSKPLTVTGKDHRGAYADDGDYFSKANIEDVIDAAYSLMHEFDPSAFPALY